MATPYQLPSSFSGGMAGAVESVKRGQLPQAITSPVVNPAKVKQSVLPKKIDKSSQSFKDKLVNKYPEGVASDGRRYADIPSYELVKMVSNKFPEGVTSDGVPYKDYITGTEKATLGLQGLQKAPGANIRQSIIQSGKEMGRGLVQPIVGLGKGIYKAGTDIADLADLSMEKAPEDRGIIQKTLANVGTGIKEYATADTKAFQQAPGIKTGIGIFNPFSEKKTGAVARVLNRGIGDVMGGAMETVLTPEAQQTVGTALAPVGQLFNKGLSYVPEGDKRDIAEAALNVLPIKIPGVKTALGKVSKTVGDIKLPKSTPGNIDDYVLKTYEKGVRPSVTSAKKPAYKENVVGAVKTITENKPNLKLLDEFGEETGKLPQTLREFTQAIDQTKKSIFDEYDAIQKKAGGKGAEVKLTTVADELQKVANDPVILDTNPAIADYAQKASERFLERGKYTTQQAQDAIKSYNTSLEAFYKNPSYETASKAAIDAMIVNNMRKGLDDAIESLGGKGYQALKNKYGSVKSIEKDVVNRAIVDGRKNAKGLLDFTDVFSGAEVIRGILTLNPATFATGVGASLIKTYYKYLNNPNTSIKKLFKTTEKSYLPRPKTQPANNIAPIPTKIPSNAPIKEKVSLPIIQKTEVKAKLPKKETPKTLEQYNKSLQADDLAKNKAMNAGKTITIQNKKTGVTKTYEYDKDPAGYDMAELTVEGGLAKKVDTPKTPNEIQSLENEIKLKEQYIKFLGENPKKGSIAYDEKTQQIGEMGALKDRLDYLKSKTPQVEGKTAGLPIKPRDRLEYFKERIKGYEKGSMQYENVSRDIKETQKFLELPDGTRMTKGKAILEKRGDKVYAINEEAKQIAKNSNLTLDKDGAILEDVAWNPVNDFTPDKKSLPLSSKSEVKYSKPIEDKIPDNILKFKKSDTQTVYHGTRYEFDDFDVSRLYTGEGNTGFGEGIYFADKGGARGYANKLAQEKGEGKVYKAIIPADKYLMDLDKYIDEQPYIQKALRKLPDDVKETVLKETNRFKSKGQELEDITEYSSNGSTLYKLLEQEYGSAEATEILNRVGIKGNVFNFSDNERYQVIFDNDYMKKI